MRVGILTDLMDHRPAGMGSYVRSLVQHLLEVDKGADYVLLHGRKGGHELYKRAEEISVGEGGLMALAAKKFINYPRAIRDAGLDLVHYPDYFGPFMRRPPCPAVETIHDLVPFVLPDTHQWDVNFTFRRVFPAFIAPNVDRFIAVSENTKADMARFLNISGSRVTVIPEAAASIFRPVEGGALRKGLSAHGLRPGYILTVGTLEPRKNIETLLEAYALLRERGLKRKLVLAGKKGWKYEGIFETWSRLGLGESVRHLDYVPFEDLPALYSGASLMAYPSQYEGFGLPPLEAMACGCPVVSSNVSSIPEVVGNAGLLIDPKDPAGLAGAMEDVLRNKEMRRELSEKGVERASGFSWERTARETANLYREVARSR